MKKAACVVMLFVAILIIPQSDVYAVTRSGIKAGLSAAGVAGNDALSAATVPGWFAGVYTTWGWNDILAIQPELLYSVKGMDATLPAPLGTVDIRLHYLEVPVLGILSIPVGATDFQLFAGPYLAYLMTVTNAAGIELTTPLNQLNRIDYGVVAGAGIGFDFLFGRLTLGARYSAGLSSLDDAAAGDFRNNVTSVYAGFEI